MTVDENHLLFSKAELAEFESQRMASDKEKEVSLAISTQLATVLNDLHKQEFSQAFWNMLLLPHIRRCQVAYKNVVSESSKKVKAEGRTAINMGQFRTGSLVPLIRAAAERIRYPLFAQIVEHTNKFILGFPQSHHPEGSALPVARPLIRVNAEKKKRQALQQYVTAESSSLYKATFETLPQFLVEDFCHWMSSIPIHEPGSKSFHVCLEGNEFMRMVLALYREHGAEIHRYQHGSHYGEQHNMEFPERECSDFFHSWGWKIEQKDVADVAYRLKAFKSQYEKHRSDGVLKSDLLVCLPALSDGIFDRERAKIIYLLNNLDRRRHPRILVRPRPVSRFKLEQRLDSELKHLNVEIDRSNRPISRSMAESRAVIHLASPSTTFLEALFVGQPIMAVLVNPRPTELVIPYYSHLIARSVYHRSVVDLVNALNQLDLISWFSEIREDRRIMEFQRLFLGSG